MSRRKGEADLNTKAIKCSVCDTEIERARHIMKATCFNCKEKRRKKLSFTRQRALRQAI